MSREKGKEPDRNQGRLTDFFGISKDPRDSRDQGYVSMSSMRDKSQERQNRPNTSPRNTSNQQNSFQPSSFLSSNYRPPSSSRPEIDLGDCATYALPHHIPKIWKVVKPRLLDMREGKIISVIKFLEVMHDFIQSHYSSTLRNLNLQTLNSLMDVLSPEETKLFFQKTLPSLAKLALEVEILFKEPLYILKQNTSSTVSLNKRQVACLLAHMFFCTLHKQNNHHLKADCNFTNLYRESKRNKVKLEKLKCLYNYFKRITNNPLNDENITYERITLKPKVHGNVNLDYWQGSSKPLRKCIMKDLGGIEDEKGAIQVDFANMNIGGGVLDHGCVQEEIRFLVSPELMVSMLISETMQDHEAIMIVGTERYSAYTGYSDTFKYGGNLKEDLRQDSFLRRDSMVLAIDAVDYAKTSSQKIQFKKERILRELNKAYIGFFGSETEDKTHKKVIATGRWGCGAFRGDSQLKFAIQWIAASQAGREMVFYRFEDQQLKAAERVINKYKESSVRELVAGVNSYNSLIFSEGASMSLFEFLLNVE